MKQNLSFKKEDCYCNYVLVYIYFWTNKFVKFLNFLPWQVSSNENLRVQKTIFLKENLTPFIFWLLICLHYHFHLCFSKFFLLSLPIIFLFIFSVQIVREGKKVDKLQIGQTDSQKILLLLCGYVKECLCTSKKSSFFETEQKQRCCEANL